MIFIEISQDGAGVVLNTDASQVGFYTEDVATCAVYAFFGKNGLCVIHDTGQLSLRSIRSQIDQIGQVHRVVCAQNKSLESAIQTKAHQDRSKRLLNLIKFKKSVEKFDLPAGAVYVTQEGVSLDGPMSSVTRIPDRERRLMINILNNLFSPTNSESVPTDVQYENGGYTANPKLLLKIEEMNARAEREKSRGDGDYWNSLNKARALGSL